MPTKHNEVDIDQLDAQTQGQQEKLQGQIRAGAYLKQLRNDRQLSLSALGEHLGVSSAYLSNIESGVKSMSDYFARQVADFFEIEENILFELLGRVPLLAKEELVGDSNLQKLLTEIRIDPRFDDERKQKLYDQMYRLYKTFPE